MHLDALHLHDVRNYERLDLRLTPGVNLFYGPNAQGKTNLLEAVSFLTLGRSHRTSSDQALVRMGTEAAVIRAEARSDAGQRIEVSLELRQGRNRALVNGQPQQRLRDAYGHIRSVMLAPEDLELVRGDPGDRRRFLDDLLGSRRPAYLAARSDLDRSLQQRNALLRDARQTGRLDREVLQVWTDTYLNHAAAVLAARIAAVHALAAPVRSAYADLVSESPVHDVDRLPVVAYDLSTGRRVDAVAGSGVPHPAELRDELAEGLAARADDERRRGTTLAGPHRDELYLGLGPLPAKGYASHGEQWSLALGLKLAARDVIAEVGDAPIVLLDDVFAELDTRRRERLAARCATFDQVFITAAVGTEVPISGTRFDVLDGRVTAENSSEG